MAISREAVIWGFIFFLGRNPEYDPHPTVEEGIRNLMTLKDEKALAEVLIKCPEFQTSPRFKDIIYLNNSRISYVANTFRMATSSIRILVLGNCQSRALAALFQAMTGDVIAKYLLLSDGLDIPYLVSENDLIFMHNAEFIQLVEPSARSKIRIIPSITYSAFHPDLVYITNSQLGTVIDGPMGDYQSSIAFYGWFNGFSEDETIKLFSEDVFESLGFFDFVDSSKKFLIDTEKTTGISLKDLIDKWSAYGCWMYSINHPKLFVLASLARVLLEREGIATLPGVEQYVHDDLVDGPVWPIYPEIGQHLAVDGNYLFKRSISNCPQEHPISILGLKDFIHESFNSFSKYRKEDLICERLTSLRYQGLASFLAKRQSTQSTAGNQPKPAAKPKKSLQSFHNPYQDLPDYQFWRRAIERLSMKDVDPVVHSRLTLNKTHKVATAGSCFAQHISRTLQKNGFNYYVTEKGDGLANEEIERRNFKVFSARFGNLYTARQLLQLFDRAYGTFTPNDSYWKRSDDRFVDAFRPQIEPEGFISIEELEKSRNNHFAFVREMFENLDVFVFTLGLTETWQNQLDGAVYPLAPGVVAGEMNPTIYSFLNFGVSEVVADLNMFIQRLLGVNPRARMLLTVSPVPLIATYENNHVLVSTTYSKSVLRVAAEEVARHNSMCEYFPSYEIITGNYTKSEYFEDDLRSIKSKGVDHVMRLFFLHYSSEKIISVFDQEQMRENALISKVVCDEKAIDTESCR